MEQTNILSLRNITKTYSGVTVLDDVSLDIRRGEIHALIGANGAGKSTLIKAVSGAILPDSGTMLFDGTAYSAMTPELSSRLGIQVIYQEFNLIPSLSIAENIFLGHRLENRRLVDFKLLEQKARDIFAVFEVELDVSQPVKNLSVAYKQMVEIAKALSQNIKLLVLDEPTAPLSNKEVEVLLKFIRSLKEKGVSVIYISHRIEEVFEICDRVTVLRDGKKIVTLDTQQTNRRQLINYMINAEIGDEYPPRLGKQEKTVLLDVKDLCGKGFAHINFQVHKGEILGITGLVGAKRTEIVRAIFGADRKTSGEIRFEGKPISIKGPDDAIRLGIVMIPEERKSQGVVLNLPVQWNLTMAVLRRISRYLAINFNEEKRIVEKYKDTFSIKVRSMEQKVSTLSGGNQQKVVLSKWLASDPKLIILDEPTRGIDVGTKKEIYSLINSLADRGIGVILISSEMDEMIGLSDRMVVLSEGEITARLEKDEFNKQTILHYASGNK